jgi:hypothetical protein
MHRDCAALFLCAVAACFIVQRSGLSGGRFRTRGPDVLVLCKAQFGGAYSNWNDANDKERFRAYGLELLGPPLAVE